MSASLPGNRPLPESQYDLSTYWGRVMHSAGIADPRTLFAGSSGLERAKKLLISYKTGEIKGMSPELWHAKKIVDSTLHPDTGEPVFLPFRMSCFVFSNLVVTAGMLTPGLGTAGTIGWQVANQSLNVAINSSNANKSAPMSVSTLAKSFLIAVTASVGVAVGIKSAVPMIKGIPPQTRLILDRLAPFAAVASAGVLNVYLMRAEERRVGIDVFPRLSAGDKKKLEDEGESEAVVPSLGKSRKAANMAVGQTALSRVVNATPIMVIPPLILVRLQKTEWLKKRPKWTMPINVGIVAATSFAVLPLALAVFPRVSTVRAEDLEPEFHGRGGEGGMVTYNRGL